METLIGDVPHGWRQVPLGDACGVLAGPSGARLPRGFRSVGVPMVTPKDIHGSRIVGDTVVKVPPDLAAGLSRYRLAQGDIVYVRTGDLGRHAIVQAEHIGWLFGTACLRLRPDDSLDPYYVSYYLDHPVVRDWISRNATGSAIPSLSTRNLGDLPVVVPPRVIQSAIREILGALDDKIAIHDQISQTVTALRDSLLLLLMAGSVPVSDVY